MPSDAKGPDCPYCGGKSVLVETAAIYHGRDFGWAWACENYPECDAYTGCHGKSKLPLGRLANAELRRAKRAAHRVFDPMWRGGGLTRSQAYAWLSEQLGINETECHIGMFDVEQCKGVVEVCKGKRALLGSVLE